MLVDKAKGASQASLGPSCEGTGLLAARPSNSLRPTEIRPTPQSTAEQRRATQSNTEQRTAGPSGHPRLPEAPSAALGCFDGLTE